MDEYDGFDDGAFGNLASPALDDGGAGDPFAAVEQIESADALVEDVAAEAADEEVRHEIAMSFLEGERKMTETGEWVVPENEPGKF